MAGEDSDDERRAFEQRYAARSLLTVADLHHFGRYAEPCECGEDICEGWAMGHQHEDALLEDVYRNLVRDVR